MPSVQMGPALPTAVMTPAAAATVPSPTHATYRADAGGLSHMPSPPSVSSSLVSIPSTAYSRSAPSNLRSESAQLSALRRQLEVDADAREKAAREMPLAVSSRSADIKVEPERNTAVFGQSPVHSPREGRHRSGRSWVQPNDAEAILPDDPDATEDAPAAASQPKRFGFRKARASATRSGALESESNPSAVPSVLASSTQREVERMYSAVVIPSASGASSSPGGASRRLHTRNGSHGIAAHVRQSSQSPRLIPRRPSTLSHGAPPQLELVSEGKEASKRVSLPPRSPRESKAKGSASQSRQPPLTIPQTIPADTPAVSSPLHAPHDPEEGVDELVALSPDHLTRESYVGADGLLVRAVRETAGEFVVLSARTPRTKQPHINSSQPAVRQITRGSVARPDFGDVTTAAGGVMVALPAAAVRGESSHRSTVARATTPSLLRAQQHQLDHLILEQQRCVRDIHMRARHEYNEGGDNKSRLSDALLATTNSSLPISLPPVSPQSRLALEQPAVDGSYPPVVPSPSRAAASISPATTDMVYHTSRTLSVWTSGASSLAFASLLAKLPPIAGVNGRATEIEATVGNDS